MSTKTALAHVIALAALGVFVVGALDQQFVSTPTGVVSTGPIVMTGAAAALLFLSGFGPARWAPFTILPGVGVAMVRAGQTSTVSDADTIGLVGWMLLGSSALSLGLVVLARRALLGSRRQEKRILEAGRPADAEIIDVSGTGMMVNHHPRLRVRLWVRPLDGSAAFATDKTSIWPLWAPPRVGATVKVLLDPADRTTLIYAPDEPVSPHAGAVAA